MSELKALYEAAGGRKLGYGYLLNLAEQHGYEVPKSTLGDWFSKTPPRKPQHVKYVLYVLIPYLEERAERRSPGHVPTPAGIWSQQLSTAQNAGRSRQGSHGSRVTATSRARLLGGHTPALLDVLPQELVERDEEVADLTAFVKAPDGAPAYSWWQAGPWAGKTALMAWFTVRAPAGVDVAHYVIAGRLGTDRRDGFVRAVSLQLAAAAENKRRPPLNDRNPDLNPLYEAAAHRCRERGRRLVLIVDGLDEDADAGLADPGIAGLLPKVPPCGMRVIVAGRPHPRVPVKLAPDHPLRDPAVVRRLDDSPAARIIRDTALTELDTLLNDPGIGRRLLGLLVSARGALTSADLGELLGLPPRDVEERLRTVVSRSLAPTRADLLPLDVRSEAEAGAGRQTFVPAHEELRRIACEQLGKPFLAARTQELHDWASRYRAGHWPDDTPNYLLSGYTRLLRESGDTERLTALVLDPERQSLLARHSAADVALGHLDLIDPTATATSPPPDLAMSAAAGVSREMLSSHVRPLPDAVARTIARLGDARRARTLASTSGCAVDRALSLVGVARVLRAMGHEEAAETARESARWARAALWEADHLGYAVEEAEEAAAQAALALLETAPPPGGSDARNAAGDRKAPGSRPRPLAADARPGKGRDPRGQFEDGLALLRSTHGTGTARTEAWALAAELSAPDHPEHAAALLDELEGQAERLTCEDPAEAAAATAALRLWQKVSSAAPDRADRLHDRASALAAEVWENAPTLENVSVVAAAASLVAGSRPVHAERLVASACDYLTHVLDPDADAGRLSTADAFHVEFGFRGTLAVLSQALVDIGASSGTVGRVLEIGRRALPVEPADLPEGPVPSEDEEQEFTEATSLAERAFHLAGRHAVDEAEHHLERAFALLPSNESGTLRGPVWLPDLADSLVRTDTATDPHTLLDLVRHPADRVRVHSGVALAYADVHRPADALHHARAAFRTLAAATTSASCRPYVAQALASAGEVEHAMDLIARHGPPVGAGMRAAWRKADRAARVAVAAELAPLAPEAAAELILPLLRRLDAAQHAIRSQRLLASLVELLPAAIHLPPEQRSLFDTAWEQARDRAVRSSPQSWHPEDVLVEAFLRIGDGEKPGRQLDWLARDLTNRGTGNFPSAALAVLHTALHDPATAQRVAALSASPHHRAVALTAVAAHLTRIPFRLRPVPDPIGTDTFTRSVQHLALSATSDTPAAGKAAVKPLHLALGTTGWYHTIPVLARIAPEAVTAVRDIAVVHLESDSPAW